MKTHITIYLVLTLVVFGLGYAAFTSFVDDDSPGPREETSTQKASKQKQPEPEPPQSLLVKSVRGTVERSGIAEENWTQVVPGNELFADEKLRTDLNASVKLQADDLSKIELEGRSEISIQEINDTVHRIKLELGRLNVDYKKSKKRRLKIVSEPKTGEAETNDGRFVIQRNEGTLSVATEQGEVKLSAGEKTVNVSAGSLSYVLEGAEPSPPQPIPLKVMLRVANPRKIKQAERTTTIKGRTDVTAHVTVNDTPAPVDDEGRFQVTIPLDNGKNPIEVVATTTYGSAEKTLPGVVVTNSVYTNGDPSSVDSAEVRWGKKKKKRRNKTSNDNKNR